MGEAAAYLEKTYDPQGFEEEIYRQWMAREVYRAARDPADARPCFSMVLPPPNVTGVLHVGHALNGALQDALARYKRAAGYNVLWLPGVDHAGIAAQMVVERQLAQEGLSRADLGREAFIERVWAWKEESGATILAQMRRLGFLPDWSAERFTMDEDMAAAVTKAFVDLHQDGLIYKDARLVNWDCHFLSALSDLEVENRPTQGVMWYLRYPLADGEGFITVGTTRPETLFGDVAVAVHPEDTRYKDLIGRFVRLPLANRRIPVVADTRADPEKGTGAVKITPAHDFNDFEVGRRTGLKGLCVLDPHGRLNAHCPAPFAGMDRFAAREAVVTALAACGLLEKKEALTVMVPYGDRSGTVIEPRLTTQWYLDSKVLAKPALKAAEAGYMSFMPAGWMNTYRQWMEGIQPWCLSRQLWWGHRIPAWYGPEDSLFVAVDEAAAQADATARFGHEVSLRRDEDVLDTWFSSGLWAFATLGWPKSKDLLEKFYPTDVLVTGFDIIFFWVARMMMLSLHIQGDKGKNLAAVPFKKVYINALVRDEKGQKMSKSKGNVMDPLDISRRYGADALRLCLVCLAGQDRDIRLSEERIKGFRNFITKLWNAARFCQLNGVVPTFGSYDPAAARDPLNRWILGKAAEALEKHRAAMEAGRLSEAALCLYRFVWDSFCDWYLEFAKGRLAGDSSAAEEFRAMAGWIFGLILASLHPFIPFVTEYLWRFFGEGLLAAGGAIPYDKLLIRPAESAEVDWVIEAVSLIRRLKAEASLGPKVFPDAFVAGPPLVQSRLKRYGDLIARLGGVKSLRLGDSVVRDGMLGGFVEGQTEIFLSVKGLVDIEAATARIAKESETLRKEAERLAGRLNNKNFCDRAPADVVDADRGRLAEIETALAQWQKTVGRLKDLVENS